MEQNQDIATPDKDTEKIPAVTPVTAETPVAPASSATPPEDADTARLPAVAVADGVDAVAEAPTARVPVVTPTGALSAWRFIWLRAPEFWLAVSLAAFLRLWHIDLTQVLDDQAALLRLARGAWLHGALPVTGIPSSIGTLNPPLSVYLLMPFTVLSKDPLPAAISIALWNVLGVALCYIFARRYFGRIVAASGALLFATCGAAVNYSRFIWQQNYLPPVLALWILTLYLGCVGGRRRWFVPHVALLAIAILLHPTVALLIPVSLVGLALTPRRAMPSRWEWAIAAALIALLLAPTVVWEVVSSGSDIRLFAHYLAHRGSLNLDVLRMLYAALGAPNPGDFGPQALYAQIGPWYTPLNSAAVLCFVAGMAVLTLRLWGSASRVWRAATVAPPQATTLQSRARAGALAIWRGLRADATWRAQLLLWLWIVVPVVLMLRHSGQLYVHYLMALYPAAFIVGGFAFQVAFRRAARLAPNRTTSRRLAAALVIALLALLVGAQAVESALYPATLASGSFQAFVGYGYPLAEMQQLDAALATLQAEQNARAIFISLPQDARYRAPLDYLTISEHPDRIGSAGCLTLPAPDEEPALVVATQPASPATALLANLPELTPVANLDMAGSDDISVYQMNGKLPPLLGERPLAPVTFSDTAGNGLRLDAVALQPNGLIRLRWTALGPAASGDTAPWYRISPALRSANGAMRALPAIDCQLTHWHADETVFTWVSSGAITTTTTMTQTLLIQVKGVTQAVALPTVGPVRLLAGRPTGAPLELLRPSSGAVADDTVTIPLTTAP